MQKVPPGTQTVPAPSAPAPTERPSVHPHAASPPTACTPLEALVRPSCLTHRVHDGITLRLYCPQVPVVHRAKAAPTTIASMPTARGLPPLSSPATCVAVR